MAIKKASFRPKKKLVRRVEPTKQYTKTQNKYAPETNQLKIKGVKYPNEQSIIKIITIVFAILQLHSIKHFI